VIPDHRCRRAALPSDACGARGLLAGESERRPALRKVEGDEAFEGRQRFFDIVAKLAHDRRLSRIVYTAEKVA
jgi:hypothetical protein